MLNESVGEVLVDAIVASVFRLMVEGNVEVKRYGRLNGYTDGLRLTLRGETYNILEPKHLKDLLVGLDTEG